MSKLHLAGISFLAVLIAPTAFAAGLGSQSLSIDSGVTAATREGQPGIRAGTSGGVNAGSYDNDQVNIDARGNVETSADRGARNNRAHRSSHSYDKRGSSDRSGVRANSRVGVGVDLND